MNQKRFAKIAPIVLVIAIAGVIGYFVLSNRSTTPPTSELPANNEKYITTFEKCVAAGNPKQKDDPSRCVTKNGDIFLNWQGFSDQVCAQVITPAKNPKTGEVRDFPTPCDVPSGWELIK